MALLSAVLAVTAPGVCPAQEKTMEMATLTAFATRYAENGYLRVNDGESAVGRAEIEQVARDFMNAVPDMIVRLVELRQDNDRVIFHGHRTGTNAGPGGTENAVGLTDCESDGSSPDTVGKAAGFSLHAGVAAQANREKLEGLCRYITGPALSPGSS